MMIAQTTTPIQNGMPNACRMLPQASSCAEKARNVAQPCPEAHDLIGAKTGFEVVHGDDGLYIAHSRRDKNAGEDAAETAAEGVVHAGPDAVVGRAIRCAADDNAGADLDGRDGTCAHQGTELSAGNKEVTRFLCPLLRPEADAEQRTEINDRYDCN